MLFSTYIKQTFLFYNAQDKQENESDPVVTSLKYYFPTVQGQRILYTSKLTRATVSFIQCQIL